MSAPVSVRFDVTGSDRVASETRKVSKELDALRTSTGSITSTVKQMEAGFRADALGGFSTAVTNADTKVTGLRTKLSQFGGVLAQNATSFGVATASVWGIYNAYDSLEKVQIRANAAAQRVSTLETTIATLTDRRKQAVDKGNLSAEQMAILDDRITNAHGKLAVAQQRNADLQQDVNEAWAGFVSQVGPQVVAAGASVTQLITSLRGQMGGVIPAVRNFFSSFSSGAPTISAVSDATLRAAPIMRNLATAEITATAATRGLSTAMRGLLIGTGVGIAVTAIGLLAEHFMNAADQAKQSTGAIEGDLTGINDTAANTATGFGGHMITMEDAIRGLARATAIESANVVGDIKKIKDAAAPAVMPEHVPGTAPTGGTKQAQGPFLTPEQAKQIPEVQAKLKSFTQQLEELRVATVQSGKKALVDLGFGLDTLGKFSDEASIKVADLDKKIKAAAQQGDYTATLDLIEERTKLLSDTLQTETTTAILGVVGAGDKLAESHGTTAAAATALTDEETKLDEALKKQMADEIEKIRQDADKARVEQNELDRKKIMVTTLLGEAAATQKAGESNTDYATRLEMLSSIRQDQIDKERTYSLGLIQTAVQLGINKTQQAALTAAISEGDAAVQDLILSDQSLISYMTEENRLRDLTNQGLVDGRMRAIDFADTTDRQIAANQQYLADLDTIATMLDVTLPAGLDHTTANMETLIATAKGSPEAFDKLKQSLIDVIETDFAPFNKKLDDLLGKWSDKEGKQKLEDFMKNIFPKGVRKEVSLWLDFQTDEKRQKDRIEFIIATLLRPAGDKTFMINPGIKIDPKDVDDMLKKWRDDIKKNTDKSERGPDSLNGIFLNAINKALDDIKKGKNPLDALKDLFNDPTLQAALQASGINLFTSSIVDSIKNSTLPEDAKQKMIALVNQANPGSVPIDILLDPTFGITGGEGLQSEALDDIFRNEGGSLRQKIEQAIGVTTPIEVKITANIEEFLKGANNVASVADFIDKLKPIVDFMGDHSKSGNFSKTADQVYKTVQFIDKLRPIVDFMGDHSSSGNFMDVADDVQSVIDDIDGTVVNVEFHAFRTGNWSTKIAQHGLHEILQEDTLILAHKGEKVDITPKGSPSPPLSYGGGSVSVGGGGTPTMLHVEMPIYIGSQLLTRIIKDIPLSDTGMFPAA